MSIGSVNSGQQYGPAQSGPSNNILAHFYRTDLEEELKIARRDADAQATDKIAALTPIIMNDAQQANLDQSVVNGIAMGLQNGGDATKLKAAEDFVRADNDQQSFIGATNPSPQPNTYNQSNTSSFVPPPYSQQGPPGSTPPPYSPQGTPNSPNSPPPYSPQAAPNNPTSQGPQGGTPPQGFSPS
jgi:hypothetical protein